MASIKQLDDHRFKITVSNGYRPDGKKICKAKTIRVPESIPKRGISQYVAHEAEELERQFKTGYSEDGNMTFQEFAERLLARQVRYAPSTLESYRRMLGRVYRVTPKFCVKSNECRNRAKFICRRQRLDRLPPMSTT